MLIPIVNYAGVVPVSVAITPASFSVAADATQQLAAAVANRAGAPLPGAGVEWSTSDENVATVDASGLVTGIAAGTCTITARSRSAVGASACTVTG